jgi:hypothetical protein
MQCINSTSPYVYHSDAMPPFQVLASVHPCVASSAMFKLACLCVFQCTGLDTSMLSLILPAINGLHLTMPCRTFSQSATPCGSIVCWFIVTLRCFAGVLLHECVNSVVVCFVASLILQENWWCLYLVRGLHLLSSHEGYCAPGRRLPGSNLSISQRRGKRFPYRLPRLPGACLVRGYKHKSSSPWQGQWTAIARILAIAGCTLAQGPRSELDRSINDRPHRSEEN